jgi:hypothetical protein
MRFLQLDDDHVLPLNPQARQTGRCRVRLIAGNPVTMGQMTRRRLLRPGHHPHPGTARRRNPGRLRHRASAIAPYGDAAASQVAGRLDTEVLPPAPRDRHTGHGSTSVTQRLSAVADGPERRARDHEHIVLIGRLPAEW